MNTSAQFSSLLVQEAHQISLQNSAEAQNTHQTSVVNLQSQSQVVKRMKQTVSRLVADLLSAKPAARVTLSK